jgi:bacterial/archaeal transporter family-2 protein
MQWILGFFAVLAGISNPLQSGSNSALQKGLQAPVVSALLVYAVGTLCLMLCIPFLGLPMRDALGRLDRVPWWVFIGGICNALFLVTTLLVTKKLGSATFTTIVVVAATVTSLLLDHFGLLGFEVRQATTLRLVGGAFAIGGVVLIALF